MSDGQPHRPLADTLTHASIFLRLNRTEAAPREVAWRQFYEQYAPVIAGYARQRGASAQQADEVVQSVIAGFFEASPRFVYDPARGRFRAYLRTCATNALHRIRKAQSTISAVPVDEVEEAAGDSADEVWDRLWRQQILRRAIELARDHYTRNGNPNTFLAFERNVLLNVPAPQCAEQLGMNVASVHQAKTRVTAKLKEIRETLTDDEG